MIFKAKMHWFKTAIYVKNKHYYLGISMIFHRSINRNKIIKNVLIIMMCTFMIVFSSAQLMPCCGCMRLFILDEGRHGAIYLLLLGAGAIYLLILGVIYPSGPTPARRHRHQKRRLELLLQIDWHIYRLSRK